jgi:hypothetical protein
MVPFYCELLQMRYAASGPAVEIDVSKIQAVARRHLRQLSASRAKRILLFVSVSFSLLQVVRLRCA